MESYGFKEVTATTDPIAAIAIVAFTIIGFSLSKLYKLTGIVIGPVPVSQIPEKFLRNWELLFYLPSISLYLSKGPNILSSLFFLILDLSDDFPQMPIIESTNEGDILLI